MQVSRNTVRRVIRSEATEFKYAREVQPRRALGRWVPELDHLLNLNPARPARERVPTDKFKDFLIPRIIGVRAFETAGKKGQG